MYFDQDARKFIQYSWTVEKLSLSGVTTAVKERFGELYCGVERHHLQREIHRYLKVTLPYDDPRLNNVETGMPRIVKLEGSAGTVVPIGECVCIIGVIVLTRKFGFSPATFELCAFCTYW